MAISQDIPQPSITEFSLKIAYVTFHWNLPGDNELNSVSKRGQQEVDFHKPAHSGNPLRNNCLSSGVLEISAIVRHRIGHVEVTAITGITTLVHYH